MKVHHKFKLHEHILLHLQNPTVLSFHSFIFSLQPAQNVSFPLHFADTVH